LPSEPVGFERRDELRAGWFERASAWTIARLTDVGLPPTEPPKIMYQDVLGTVLRTRSGDRATYTVPASVTENALFLLPALRRARDLMDRD
jgi:hypothetical protein